MPNANYLIVGLGNPGAAYEHTRHNVGFRVIKALAQKYGIELRPALTIAKGSLGDGVIEGKSVRLLLPLTYMNESGLAVRRCCDYFKIGREKLIVVVDDVALPFGALRLREEGSSGGHNGLKSVAAHLSSEEYARLRLGIGDRTSGDLADHVLARFSAEEEKEMPAIIDRAVEALEKWLKEKVNIGDS